jgi:hypothetical protein
MDVFKRFVMLDWRTVKPLRPLVLWGSVFVVGAVLFVILKNFGILMGIIAGATLMFATLAFQTSERSNMDALYPTLGVSRRAVVRSRYLYLIVADALLSLVALGVALICKQFVSDDESLRLLACMSLLMFLMIAWMQLLQLPIFFKLSMTRSKLLGFLPMLAIIALFMIVMITWGDPLSAFVKAHLWLCIIGPVIITLAALYVSYRLSVRWYERREL